MSHDEDVSLKNLLNGQVIERFDYELSNVLANIIDPNTPATAKRKITVDVVFTPDKSRDLGKIDVKVKSTLAPMDIISGRMFIAITRNGPVATEDNPRQPPLPNTAPANVVPITQQGGN